MQQEPKIIKKKQLNWYDNIVTMETDSRKKSDRNGKYNQNKKTDGRKYSERNQDDEE